MKWGSVPEMGLCVAFDDVIANRAEFQTTWLWEFGPNWGICNLAVATAILLMEDHG